MSIIKLYLFVRSSYYQIEALRVFKTLSLKMFIFFNLIM